MEPVSSSKYEYQMLGILVGLIMLAATCFSMFFLLVEKTHETKRNFGPKPAASVGRRH